jgi:bifunctional non-homologous end joining protein LigD
VPHRRALVAGAIPLTDAIDHRDLMLLDAAPMPFRSPDWGWEIKYDGFRALAVREGASTRLISRNGRDLADAFPDVIAALRALPPDSAFDGELTVPDGEGRPDWHALRARAFMSQPGSIRAAVRARPAVLYVFDVLAIADQDLRPSTLVARRKTLDEIFVSAPTLRLSELWDDGIALFRAATDHGLEGVVGKRLASPYRGGRSADWIKVRARTARPQARGSDNRERSV